MFIPCWNRRKSEILLAVLYFGNTIMYIYGMKFSIDKKKIAESLRNGAIAPICLLILFLVLVMADSVSAFILAFLMILLINAYVFFDSDWKVSRKMNSIRSFGCIQNAVLVFFFIEFVMSLICIFCGWAGNLSVLVVGFVTLVVSVFGSVHAIFLKVNYDCFN